MRNRAILILAWTVPLTFGTLSIGAVIRGQQLSGEALGIISAVCGAIAAGVFTVRNSTDKGGKDE